MLFPADSTTVSFFKIILGQGGSVEHRLISTISVVIIAFRLELSMAHQRRHPQNSMILANPSGGGKEPDSWGLILNVGRDYIGIADRCKWYKCPALLFSFGVGPIFSPIENRILEMYYSIWQARGHLVGLGRPPLNRVPLSRN
jgi:hypothetical protein